MHNEERRIIYCLPFVLIESDIFLNGLTLRPLKSILHKENCVDLLKNKIFDNLGTVIETSEFKSGDYYSLETDVKISNFLEIIKFSYFFISPSDFLDSGGFLGSESFECFRLLEKRKNFDSLTFEHKVFFSNGMTNFSFSLEKYYNSRASLLNNFRAKVSKSELDYVNPLIKHINDKDNTLIIRLYNKCWGLYSIHDFLDKALYSRVSIEVLIKKQVTLKGNISLTKKNYLDEFFNKATSIIKHKEIDCRILSLYEEKILPNIEKIKENIDEYLNALADARHSIAHDGVHLNEFTNVAPYLIFFPLLFVVFLSEDDISEKDVFRIIFLLGLFKYDINTWNYIDFKQIQTKRSALNCYIYFSRVFHKYLNGHPPEVVEAFILGIENWLIESEKS